MRVLVDTNVVARLAQPAHQLYSAAARVVDDLLDADHDLCIVPQVLYEFWVVATKPIASNGLALSLNDTMNEMTRLKRFFTLLRDERTVFERWEELVQRHHVSGKAAHDARLVAAMQRHNLGHILTFNSTDFARYDNIAVLNPSDPGLREAMTSV